MREILLLRVPQRKVCQDSHKLYADLLQTNLEVNNLKATSSNVNVMSTNSLRLKTQRLIPTDLVVHFTYQ